MGSWNVFVLATTLAVSAGAAGASLAPKPPEQEINRSSVFLTNTLDRHLRYTPVGTDFVITNGGEFFNRPLYGGGGALRVDAGDVPEFSIYARGRGGNLRLGLRAGGRSVWLHQADQVVARYRSGAVEYEIRDAILEEGVFRLQAIGTRSIDGLMVRAGLEGGRSSVELLFAFGGVNGMRGRRNGDIGCEKEPVSRFFQLRAEQCADNEIVLAGNSFAVRGRPGVFGGRISSPAELAISDATNWADALRLFDSAGQEARQPVVIGSTPLFDGEPVFIGIQRVSGPDEAEALMASFRESMINQATNTIRSLVWKCEPDSLAECFEQEEAMGREVAERVTVRTPDPFINAAAAALNVAADAVWDTRQQAYLHGGVAWRVRLLGWRVSYAGDALGWHDRTAKHFAGFAREQNTNPIPAEIPPPEESANLSRNESALHSNGNMTSNHYDMNLVGVDAFFRHLLWTGDLDFARQMWPVLERHFAWERRLFRREFGPEGLPLYEAYAAIWASDDLAYNGGGATHASAYNLYHNRMAARVARLLGKDPTPYEEEADLIAQAMKEHLWMKHQGWYAEWKDLLGRQAVHPNPAVWTFYHAIDSEVPTPFEAWQMMEFVRTQNPRFPLYGPGVPEGNHTIATSRWMPYTWSLNNVVMAESMHTALAYWQAGRAESAFPLFKGAILDSMYLGLCPGNVGMCTFFDANRRESQRDFGDGVGATSRAFIEGLFGFQPDLLDGEITWRPGFPSKWDHATMSHPDVEFGFKRSGRHEHYDVTSRFAMPVRLRLQVPTLADHIDSVLANGEAAEWKLMDDSVGQPRIEITAPAGSRWEVTIQWDGTAPARTKDQLVAKAGDPVHLEPGAEVLEVLDPQGVLSNTIFSADSIDGTAAGVEGHRTIFAKLAQGGLEWWQPIPFEILPTTEADTEMDWSEPVTGSMEMVDMSALFNARVTDIFQNDYRSPRSPFCSLATPQQGIGSWCHPNDEFAVDDSGLRALSAAHGGKILLPNGVPLATPSGADAANTVFVSQWDNYPNQLTLPLQGSSSHAFLLMAGSTSAMQSRFDNGEVIVTYTDGTVTRLALHNPTTWWPIDQDYYIDDFAFALPGKLPVRVDLKTGAVRVLERESFMGKGGVVPGGAATVLDLALDPSKDLQSITLRAIANEVVLGLMGVTLQR